MSATEKGILLESLVATKLVPPEADPRAIVRESLAARLFDASCPNSVMSVVAPAGSGKSTLLAQLHAAMSERGDSTCWLNLEAEDNDPATFAIYFICALSAIEPAFARDELTALGANPIRFATSMCSSTV